MAKRMYVIKKNKRYVMNDDSCYSYTKNINKAAVYMLRRDAVRKALVDFGDVIVKVQKNKHGNLMEVC